MKDLTVVIAQSDSTTAQVMAARMHEFFRNISVARSVDELRTSIPKHHADVVVLDLELADLEELKTLRRSFVGTRFVCTHRVPDEEMWTSAVDAGADDVCNNSDVNGIVHAVTGCGFGSSAAA